MGRSVSGRAKHSHDGLAAGDPQSLGAEAVLQAFGVPQVRKDRFRKYAAIIYQWAMRQPGVESHEHAIVALNNARLGLRAPPAQMPAVVHFYNWTLYQAPSVTEDSNAPQV